MKKIKNLLMLPIVFMMLVVFGTVNAQTIPDVIEIDKTNTANGDESLKYIQGVSGNLVDHIKSPLQYAFVNGESIPVYCYEAEKMAFYPDGGFADDAYILNKDKELTAAGYVYIIENGYPSKSFTGDAKKDYYITQIALWWYQDLINGTNYLPETFKNETAGNMVNYKDPEGLFGYIKSLATAATKANASSIHLNLTSAGFAYTSDYKNFKANVVATTNGILSTPKLTTSANVTNPNLSISGKTYTITVPVDKVNGMSGSVSLELSASRTTKKIFLYKTSSPSTEFQHLIVPFTVSLNTKDSIELSLAKTGIRVNKVNGNGETVKGATLRLSDSDGKLIEEWVTDGTVKEIYNFKPGKVTLTEVKTPEGYISMDSITKEATPGSVISITATNVKNKTSIIKLDKNGKPLEGATFELTDASGKKYTWVSSKEAYVIEGATAGKCTLKETKAPEGYALITSTIPCEIKDNTVNEIKVTNTETSVSISKQDATTGEELPGATLVLKDSKGNEIDKWVSTSEPHIVTGLAANQKYILEETIAPEGYALTSSIEFTLNEKGVVDEPVIMKNEIITTKFYKKDIKTNEMLVGAILLLKDSEGNEVERWTSTTEPYEIKGLVAGQTYTLEEVTAPEGYDKTEPVTFTIESDKTTQEVSMYDSMTIIDIPDTASFTSLTMCVAGGLVLLSGIVGLSIYSKRHKREQN